MEKSESTRFTLVFFFKMSIEAKDMLQFKLLKNEIISG